MEAVNGLSFLVDPDRLHHHHRGWSMATKAGQRRVVMDDLHLVKHKYGKTEERVYDVAVPMEQHGEVYWITSTGHRVYPEWTCKLNLLLYRDMDFDTIEPILGAHI
jgi:hypothetical protein